MGQNKNNITTVNRVDLLALAVEKYPNNEVSIMGDIIFIGESEMSLVDFENVLLSEVSINDLWE